MIDRITSVGRPTPAPKKANKIQEINKAFMQGSMSFAKRTQAPKYRSKVADDFAKLEAQ